MDLWKGLDRPPASMVPLADYTTWRIGGAARWFAEPRDTSELQLLFKAAARANLPVRILGGGSNLLIADGILDGIVLRLSPSSFGAIRIDSPSCSAVSGGGAPLAALVKQCNASGLSGLQAMAGIPGSVAGAVRMNAGASALGVGAYVQEVRGIGLDGCDLRLRPEDILFGYRQSNLGAICITDVVFRLDPGEPNLLRTEAAEALERKRNSQPLGAHSAGCVFRNPSGRPAGELIDSAGCKGLREGGAVVSGTHANFFVNEGGASCIDMLRLIERVRDKVNRVHGIQLELEVCQWQ